jgi:hypothetical protein
MQVLIPDCHVLKTVKLPARGQYPETYLASLIQERTHDEFNVVCTEACFDAMEATDRDTSVAVTVTVRQLATDKGKLWRFRATSCSSPGESSPPLRSQAAAGDKQAAELPDGDGTSGLVYKTTRRPR